MGINPQEAIKKLKALMDQVDQPLKKSFQNLHQGFLTETLERFLKAREYDAAKANKMLVDCLKWRVENEIDKILRKPILPADAYRGVRDSQLVGLSGYSKEGLPVFAIGVGLSTFDKANVHDYVQSQIQINEYRDRVILPSASKKYGRPITTCVKVLDMTGLKLSALGNIKVVKPLLHERTRRKVQVLPGCGRDELLKIMDYSSLPHFCKRESSLPPQSSTHQGGQNCYSLDHSFHQQLYNYIKQQSFIIEPVEQIKKSFHVNLQGPVSKSKGVAKTIESELRKCGSGLSDTYIELEIM